MAATSRLGTTMLRSRYITPIPSLYDPQFITGKNCFVPPDDCVAMFLDSSLLPYAIS